MRLLLGIPLACIAAFAQLSRVGVTADGSKIVFVTTLRPKGTDLVYRSRAFLRDSAGYSLVAPEEVEVDRVGISPDGATTYYRTAGPAPETVIRGPRGEFRFPGTAVVSRNGRFVIADKWIDTETGESRPLPPAYTPVNAYALSDTGGALLTGPGGLALWRDGTLTPIRAPGPELTLMSPDGEWLVTRQRRLEPIPRLFLRFRFACDYHVTSLATMATRSIYVDGGCDAAGAIGERWFTGPEWTLSLETGFVLLRRGTSSGAVVFAADAEQMVLTGLDGSITAYPIAGGSAETLLRAAPAISGTSGYLVPGSPARIYLSNPPAGDPMISLNGRPLIAERDSEGIAVLLPLDLDAAAPVTLELSASHDSPFEQPPFPLRLFDWAPAWAAYPGEARAGERYDIYLHGLGTVVNPPDYGSAPEGLSHPILHDISARIGFDRAAEPSYLPLEILYAGLAPGKPGRYLLRVRMPGASRIPEPGARLLIGPPGPSGEFLSWFVTIQR